MGDVGRLLLVAGLGTAAVGLILLASQSVPWLRLGSLPGDIRVERPGYSFYFPLTTMLLVSGVLSLAFWLFSRVRK